MLARQGLSRTRNESARVTRTSFVASARAALMNSDQTVRYRSAYRSAKNGIEPLVTAVPSPVGQRKEEVVARVNVSDESSNELVAPPMSVVRVPVLHLKDVGDVPAGFVYRFGNTLERIMKMRWHGRDGCGECVRLDPMLVEQRVVHPPSRRVVRGHETIAAVRRGDFPALCGGRVSDEEHRIGRRAVVEQDSIGSTRRFPGEWQDWEDVFVELVQRARESRWRRQDSSVTRKSTLSSSLALGRSQT